MIASWPVTDFSQFRQIHVPNHPKSSNIYQTFIKLPAMDPAVLHPLRTRSTPSLVRVVQVMVVVPLMLEISWSRRCRVASCRRYRVPAVSTWATICRTMSYHFNSFHSFHIGSTWFNIENVNMVWLGMTCDIATYWNKIARCKMYRTLDVVVCWMDLVVYFSASLQSKVQTSLQLCLVQIWLAGHWCHYHWGVQEVHREGQGPLTINLSNRQSCCNQVEHVISINIRKLNNMIITYSWFFIQHNDTLPMLLPFGAGFSHYVPAWRPWKDASSQWTCLSQPMKRRSPSFKAWPRSTRTPDGPFWEVFSIPNTGLIYRYL